MGSDGEYRWLRPLFADFSDGDYVKIKKSGKICRVLYSYKSTEYKDFIKDPKEYMKNHPKEKEPMYFTYKTEEVSTERIIYCTY